MVILKKEVYGMNIVVVHSPKFLRGLLRKMFRVKT